MLKSISLAALIILAAILSSPGHPDAQTSDNVAPVPGPYQAMMPPPAMVTPYPNPGMTQVLPYWMRPQQQTGGPATGNRRQQQYISGWVWSPYAPNTNSGGGQRYYQQSPPQPMPRPAPGYWPGYQQPAYPYGSTPWGGTRPYTSFGAPQGYGVPQPPNQ